MSIQLTATVDIPAVEPVALCRVIKRHNLEWPLVVHTPRHTCATILHFNQHDLKHLPGGLLSWQRRRAHSHSF